MFFKKNHMTIKSKNDLLGDVFETFQSDVTKIENICSV